MAGATTFDRIRRKLSLPEPSTPAVIKRRSQQSNKKKTESALAAKAEKIDRTSQSSKNEKKMVQPEKTVPIILKRRSQDSIKRKNEKRLPVIEEKADETSKNSNNQRDGASKLTETSLFDKPGRSSTSASDSGSLTIDPDRILALKDIVIQAARDRRIFCIYEGHRYIAQPIREELTRRGWLECKVDRASIPRRKHSTPPDPNKLPKAEPSQIRLNHTANALVCKDPNDAGYFTIRGPDPEEDEIISNFKICTFGITNESTPHVIVDNMDTRTSNGFDGFDLDDSTMISSHIQAENCPINFFWLSSKPAVQLQYVAYTPDIANKFQKTIICSKYGLWSCLSTYFDQPRSIKFPIQYPRMFNPGDVISRAAFFFDFHLTACTSVLQWLVTTAKKRNVADIISVDGKVPLRAFEFAIRKCEIYIKFKQIGDSFMFDDFQGHDGQWSHFRYWADLITIKDARLKLVPLSHFNYVKSKSADVLRRLKVYRPFIETDGFLNLWIVKPFSAACGRGIFLTCNIGYIQQLPARYIVQKYIERPFLIEGTKFDIRQWILVTSLNPLEIWMYNECYLRFCSQPFDLRNLHESVHLSNNAIQRKYARVSHLSVQNMWDSETFKNYLKLQGFENLWDERIFPGMRDAVIMALLSSQHTFDAQRRGWFEIYGADFMLTEKISDGPCLIEINESPAMDHSTPITARLCPQMLRDVIKVVVDWRANRKSETGGWQRIYKQSLEAATTS